MAESTRGVRVSMTANMLRFVRMVVTTSPRRVAEEAAVTLGLSLTEGVGLLLLAPLLQLVGVEAQNGPLNGIVAAFARGFQALHLRPTLGVVLATYVIVVGLQIMLQWREAVLTSALQEDVVAALRLRVYDAIARSRWVDFARWRPSDLSHVLIDEIDRVQYAAYFLIELTVLTATALAYVVIAVRVSPSMTALIVLAGGLLAASARGRMARARGVGQKRSASRTAFYGIVAEHLASLKTARSYGAEAQQGREFARRLKELSAVALETTRSHAGLRRQLALGSVLLLAFIVWVAHSILIISAAQLLLLLFLFARLVPRLTGVYERSQLLATLLPAYEAVVETERRAAAAAPPAVGRPRPVTLAQRIVFDDVTFDYGGDARRPAVSDVRLVVPAGATIAIVGPSGAGKSTLADLLLGLVQPTAGRILIDGEPLTPETVESWRGQIGYVSQSTFLFHASVRANLLFARSTATEADLWHALRLAAADEFVRALPQGLDTVIGDNGVLLSGGERQRLALARALVRRPALLILDEATNALDWENEERIQRAIERLHHEMTIVIITHQLTALQRADVIHVLDAGRVVETGTWMELMSRSGSRFRRLSDAQTADEDTSARDARAALRAVR